MEEVDWVVVYPVVKYAEWQSIRNTVGICKCGKKRVKEGDVVEEVAV